MVKKITMIQAQKRPGRYNIFIDEKYAFPLSESVLLKFQVVKGMEVDDALMTQMQEVDDVSKAYGRALDYLSHSLRTVHEVADKLKKLEIPPEIIDETIDMLKDNHLLDDQNYAESYVRTQMTTSDKGPRVIKSHLRQKGITDELATMAVALYDMDEQIETATTAANKLASHYRRDAYKIQLQKIRQALMTRGFSSDVISPVMDQLDLEPDEDEQVALLARQGEKLWHRYRTLPASKQRQKVRENLYRKGFNSDDINVWLDEQV